jgi:hypothetical protein
MNERVTARKVFDTFFLQNFSEIHGEATCFTQLVPEKLYQKVSSGTSGGVVIACHVREYSGGCSPIM